MPRRPTKSAYDVIVIGAGIGGLGLATYLGQEGYSVLVAERHYRAGGYTHAFRRGKYLFDAAVRVVVGAEDGLLRHLLDAAGMSTSIPFVKIDEAYRAIYPGHDVRVPAHVEGFIEQFSALFPSEADNIRVLVSEMRKVYEATLNLVYTPNTVMLLSDPILMRYRKMSFHDMVSSFISDPYTVHMLPSLWSYYGVTPTGASAMFFSYALMRYFIEGVYYVKGSFQAFADAFVNRIRMLGGEVCLRNEVRKVIVENGAVSGVELERGDFVEAPLVVSNGDLSHLVSNLVGEAHFSPRYVRRLKRLVRSLSAFEVFIGTNLPLADMGMGHETLVYDSYNYDTLLDRHQRLGELGPQAIGAWALSCPSIAESALAPEGHHTAVLTTLLPANIRTPWKEAKPLYQAALLSQAEAILPGLCDSIQCVESGSPMTIERFTGNSEGASYGWDQTIEQMTIRPSTSTSINGLHATGHWTGTGGGVVSVLLTSYRLAQQLVQLGQPRASQKIAG